ncbi:hypothetical protein SUGI_0894810 [Cryptomeria japonica]|nr:hypothetical protein SUGI_0894810 [Cryptomeria japonica]
MRFSTTLAAFILLTLALFRPFKEKWSSKLPPGSLGVPLIGETLQFLWSLQSDKPQRFFDHRLNKFGHVFKTSLVGHPTVVVSGLEGNRFLLTNENKLVVMSWPSTFMKLVGQDCLLGKAGEQHRIVRAAFAHFLGPQALQNYMAKMNAHIQQHISEKWKGKEQVKMLPLIEELVACLSASLFFGIDEKHQQERIHELLETIQLGLFSVPVNIPGSRFNRGVQAKSEMDRILSRLIEKRKIDLRSGMASSDQDLLSVLLTFKDESGNSLTHKEIVNNFSMLLHGSYDSTSSPLTIMFKLLSSNPECYQNVVRGMQDV